MEKYFIVILSLFLPSLTFAHNFNLLGDSNNISVGNTGILRESTIIMSTRNIFNNVNLVILNDSTVRVSKNETSRDLPLQDVRTIKIHSRGFGTGALIGGGIGFVLGFIAGGQSLGYNNTFKFGNGLAGGFIVGFPIAMLGGFIGTLFAQDRLYDLGNLDPGAKMGKINSLIREFPK